MNPEVAQSKGFYLSSFSKETSPSLQVLNWASHVGIEARLLSIQFMSFSDWSASLSRRNGFNGNASCRLRHVQVQGLSFRSTGNQPNAAKMLTCGERQHYYILVLIDVKVEQNELRRKWRLVYFQSWEMILCASVWIYLKILLFSESQYTIYDYTKYSELSK